ncbi:MAG: nucleotidyltransferase domain-containing protein [Chloroflexi bacterium]|nr:nucleotidyltransferase domain-containing protein [Chloroflexota bacterium]
MPGVNRRVSLRAIRAVARTIAERFKPEKIILFGSYAYGKPKPWSDVDLMIVMDTPEGDFTPTKEISRTLSPHPFALDILVRSEAEIRRRIAIDDWFLEDVVTKGKVLYERNNGGVGRKSRKRLRSGSAGDGGKGHSNR